MNRKKKRFISWLIIAMLVIPFILLIVSCDAAKAEVPSRFVCVEKRINVRYTAMKSINMYIIQDTVTGVKYILTGNGGICPLIEPEKTKSVSTTNEIDIPIDDYTEAARYIAKTVYGEARGCSTTQQAAVIWCILNRVDEGGTYSPEDVIRVVTKKNQFHGYVSTNPVTDEHYDLAIDVLSRWLREKNGESEVGRVLPAEYLYFGGNGKVNRFRTEWDGGTRWDWSLKSPYEEV